MLFNKTTQYEHLLKTLFDNFLSYACSVGNDGWAKCECVHSLHGMYKRYQMLPVF